MANSIKIKQLPINNSLRISYINLNSVNKKFHELQTFLILHDVDVLCVSETRLKPHHSIRQFNGYEIYRKNEHKSSERGVAVIVKCKSSLIF